MVVVLLCVPVYLDVTHVVLSYDVYACAQVELIDFAPRAGRGEACAEEAFKCAAFISPDPYVVRRPGFIHPGVVVVERYVVLSLPCPLISQAHV